MPIIDDEDNPIITVIVHKVAAPSMVAQVVPSPVPVTTKVLGAVTELVGSPGPQGPPGPAGSGSGSSNLFIQDTAPVSPPTNYVWYQTNSPSAGNFQVWVAF